MRRAENIELALPEHQDPKSSKGYKYSDLINEVSIWYYQKIERWETTDTEKRKLIENLGTAIDQAKEQITMLLDTKDIKNDKNTPKNTKEIYFKLGEELAKAQSKAAKLHYKQCKAKLMTGFLASLTCTFTSEVTSRSKLDQAIQKKICESNSKADNGITIVGLAWDGMSYQTEDQKKKETQNTQETRKELSFSSR